MTDVGSGTDPSALQDQSQHQLKLMKGDHCWQFRWKDGDEHGLISILSDLAADQCVEFDWFDAAMVRHHLALCRNETAGYDS